MNCPGCGGRAKFSKVSPVGEFVHLPGCEFDLDRSLVTNRDQPVIHKLSRPDESLDLSRRLQEALALLSSLQWSGYDPVGNCGRACPVCGRLSGIGHVPGCKLKSLIGGR